MRQTFACPHCNSRFGDPVWRDNHVEVCARAMLAEKHSSPPLSPMLPRPSSKPNFRLLPEREARALEQFFALNPELPRQP